MNIALWVLQVLLALHTLMGAAWKLSNPAQAVPSLSAIPNAMWIALSGVEVLCAIGLILPAIAKRRVIVAPAAAAVIAAEMLMFTVVNLASGNGSAGEIVYWLVVAALCAFVVYGRTIGSRASR